jgi:hypothetical protein
MAKPKRKTAKSRRASPSGKPAKARPKPAKARAKAKPATKARSAKATPKARPARASVKAPAKAPATGKAVAKSARQPPRAAKSDDTRKPAPLSHPLAPTGSPTGTVVQILDSENPVEALRGFLDGIEGELTIQQGQIALGSAQLMLLPIAREHRGGSEVKELLDLVLSRWGFIPERTGFHAQELLRNALAAVGDDRDRLAQLAALVPSDASPELRFNLACAYAIAGDRAAMLRAARAALAAGASPTNFERDSDFDAFRDDPELRALLDRATPPEIAVDIRPHVVIVRSALDAVIGTLREYGETVKLEPPASLDTIMAAERAGHIQLPNDYRALLAISDGMTLWDRQFFGTLDYRTDTLLAKRARDYLETSAKWRGTGIEDCVPLANWGQPNDWLLYDPFGRYRGGEPGVVLMVNADEYVIDGVAAALEQFDEIARDLLGTN